MSASAFDDLWSKTAADQASLLPAHDRDQVEALVRGICRDPRGPHFTADPADPRVLAARVGRLAVFFRIDEIGSLVYILRVDARG